MTSREYAQKLRELADYLDARNEFETGTKPYMFVHASTKREFLDAVLALKPGTKEVTTGSYPQIKFRPTIKPEGVEIILDAPRDVACVKVQDEVWECEPLLRPEDEAAVDQTSE
jgi:hypothetical protein